MVKTMNPKTYLEEYLKPFIGKIVLTNQYDKWQEERNKFLYDGKLNDKRLRNVLPNEIIIEFDFTQDGYNNPIEAKKEAFRWHEKSVAYVKTLNIAFHTTDHDGKCPHIRIPIYGLDILPDYTRTRYKEQFASELLRKIRFTSDLLCLDRGLLTTNSKLISIELQPHFKAEHNEKIEQITYIHEAQRLVPLKKDIEQIEKDKKQEPKELVSIKPSDIKTEDLKKWFKEHYQLGTRNSIDLAFFGYCKKLKISKEDSFKIYSDIRHHLQLPIESKHLKRMEYSYLSDSPAVWHFLKNIKGEDHEIHLAARDFYDCFKVYDKSLISAEDILNMDIPPVEWDIENLIMTNGYHFFAGISGKFKTYLSFFMARSLISGKDFLGRKVKERRVLLVDEESRERTLKLRTQKTLIDLTPEQRRNFKYSISKGIKFDDKQVTQLEEDIKNSRAEVVIMDSFVRFFIGNENSSDDVKKSFALLKPLMDKYNCSFIIIHHFNKGGTNDMNSLRGSSDLTAQCDTILLIDEDFKNNYSIWLEKNRHGDKGNKIKFEVIDSPDQKTISINLIGEFEQKRKTADDKNASIFYRFLIKEGMDSFSLAGNMNKFEKQLGMGKNIIYKVKDMLIKQGRLINEGKGFYKASPDEFVEIEDEK